MKKVNEQTERIKKLMNLRENKQTYDYGCAMLYFSFPEINKIHDAINPEHIYVEEEGAFGLESEPHCTLLFGLHDDEVSVDEIENVLDQFTYYTCKLHNPSLFENEKYDVLKFDVTGDNLPETNEKLKQFPFTTDYPDYHPHMTIAYLKPGEGKQYVEMLKKSDDFWVAPTHAIYSQPDGTKNKITIKVD